MSMPADHEVPVLEYDETVPPRPEEEVADVARSRPDREGHGGEPPVGAAAGAEAATAPDTSAPDA